MDMSNGGILKTEVVDGVVVISFERGRFREENEILVTLESLSQHIASKQNPRILLDMSTVEYLSSAGLGQLVGLLKKTKANGGQFKLCSLQDAISELFEVMRLHMIFEIHPAVEDALEAFRKEGAKV